MPLESEKHRRRPSTSNIWLEDICPSRIEDMALKGPYLMNEKKKRQA